MAEQIVKERETASKTGDTTQTAVQAPEERRVNDVGSPAVRVTGRRALAHVVDLVLIGGAFVALVGLFGAAWDLNFGFFSDAGFSIGLLPVLGFLVAVFLYYALMEAYLGRTLGKMLFGIRVIREDTGGRPGLAAASIRTVLRLIDGILFYLVGLVAVLASPRRQRLGDMAAHTLVVRNRKHRG